VNEEHDEQPLWATIVGFLAILYIVGTVIGWGITAWSYFP
jgi:hypothetical protein